MSERVRSKLRLLEENLVIREKALKRWGERKAG